MTHTIYIGRQKARLDAVMYQRWQERVESSQELRQFQNPSSETTEAQQSDSAGKSFDAVLRHVQHDLINSNGMPKLFTFSQHYRSPGLYQIPTLNTYLTSETYHPETERIPLGQKVEPVAYIEYS